VPTSEFRNTLKKTTTVTTVPRQTADLREHMNIHKHAISQPLSAQAAFPPNRFGKPVSQAWLLLLPQRHRQTGITSSAQ